MPSRVDVDWLFFVIVKTCREKIGERMAEILIGCTVYLYSRTYRDYMTRLRSDR